MGKIMKSQVKEGWATYLAIWNTYVEQLKNSKHKYTSKDCPLCMMINKDEALDPEVKDSYGRICPVCGSEEYWA